MNKENKIVPRLRFPEFVNEGEWETRELGMIADNLDFKRIPITGSVREKGDIPYYGASGIIDYVKDYIFDDELLCISEDGANLVDRTYPIAFTIKGKTWVNNHAHVLKFENKNTQILVETYLNTINLEKYITGATQPKLNQAKLAIITIPLSNIPAEQQKIASCLSSLDELIAAHTNKLEALKDHKKGLMQQLFPAEGETLPKLRFKEFEKDGEWVEKCVEEYFNVGSSKRVLEANWTNQGVPFYRTRELVSLNKSQPFGSEIFISEELYDDLKEKYGVPKEGDFLVSGVGTLGICYQVKANDKFYYKDGNVLLFSKKDGVESDYFRFCFQSDHIQNQIFNQVALSTVGTYTIQNAKKTTFWYPPTTDEQQKIASFLSSIDDEITAQTQKIEILKEHKKGLMQGLFPVINE